MILLLQIVLLIIGVGGVLVSAFALPDPWRWRLVIGFGALGAIGLTLTVITYEETPGVPHLGDAWRWFFIQLLWIVDNVKELLRLPAVWIVLAFGIGIGFSFRWLVGLFHTIVSRPQRPIVTEWISPEQAINRFVDQELLQKRSRARAQLRQINEQDITNKIDNGISYRTDAEYLEQCRNIEVLECLFEHLSSGRLVAKGIKIKRGKVMGEGIIPSTFWKIRVSGRELLNPENATADGFREAYRNIEIGKNMER
jgi:hypothetical protein